MVLGDAVAHGVLLWARCGACGHRAAVNPAEIAQRCGYDVPVRDVTPRLKCSRCGSRDASLTANYEASSREPPGHEIPGAGRVREHEI